MQTVTLDLTAIGSIDELHGLLQYSFSFPAYYGRNWDALWDCLGDLPDDALEIVLIGRLDAARRIGWRMNIFYQLLTDFRMSRGGRVCLRLA